MPRPKSKHLGATRGLVTRNLNHAEIVLTHEEALGLVKQLDEALTFQRGVRMEAHWGRRGGADQRHLITVASN